MAEAPMDLDFCQVAAAIPDSKYYCLGPGKLCQGGTYVGGPGDNPECLYEASWAGLILLGVLIILAIFFDWVRHTVYQKMPKEYEGVVHAFFGELMELGFVSLIAFLLKREWDGSDSLLTALGYEVGLGKELQYMFKDLHWILFGLVMSFIVTNAALLGAIVFRFRRFRKWSDQIEEGVEVQHVVPRLSKRPLRTGWLERRSKKDQQEVFIRLYYRFTDDLTSVRGDLHIPENFNLGHYLQLNSAKIMAIVTDIDLTDWATMFVLCTIAFIGWLYSRGQDSGATDVGYIIFWIYLTALPVLVCILDRKLHSIVTQLIPVESDSYVPEMPKTISRASSQDTSSSEVALRPLAPATLGEVPEKVQEVGLQQLSGPEAGETAQPVPTEIKSTISPRPEDVKVSFDSNEGGRDSMSSIPESTIVAGSNGQGRSSEYYALNPSSYHRKRSLFAFAEDEVEVEFEYHQSQEEGRRIRRRFIPPYIRQDPSVLRDRTKLQKWMGGKMINLHQNLFWFQASGPKVALRMLRYLILGSVVLVVSTLVTYRQEMLCSGVQKKDCNGATGGGVIVFLLALAIPIFSTIMLSSSLTNFVLATSVEYMKMRESIVTVIESSRKKRHLKLLRTLNSIAALIDQMSFFTALTDFSMQGTVSSGEELQRSGSMERARKGAKAETNSLPRALSTTSSRASLELQGPDPVSAPDETRGEDSFGIPGAGKLDAKEIRRNLEVVRKTRRSQEVMRASLKNVTGPAAVGRHSLEHKHGKSGRNAKRRVKDISKDLENQWHEIFMAADQEGTGVLDREKFAALLQATGNELDDERINYLFDIMDLNQNGTITFEDFIEVMADEKHGHLHPEDLANTMWTLFDKQGTGRLGPEEVKEGILKVKPNFNVEQAVELIHYIDVQRKGYIERSQFVVFVTQLLHSEEF